MTSSTHCPSTSNLSDTEACYINAGYSRENSHDCHHGSNTNLNGNDEALKSVDESKPETKISPQEQIHQSMKQSQFSSYTKFYSSIDEPEPLESTPDFDVPVGFGLEYHGHLSKTDCEKRIPKDGDYLVRRSFNKKNADHLILSLR